MSAISARLVDPDTPLASSVFVAAVSAFLMGDATANQARDFINNHILDNQGSVLTASEEADIGGGGTSIKSHYDGLPNNTQRLFYLFRLQHYSQQVQTGNITESVYDGLIGL